MITPVDTVETVVIGAGHAGLAVSRLLTAAHREHVVLDRGRVGERWRSERWDSLRLLSPNWMTRLPHWRYAGPDPDGFSAAADFVEFLERYAASFHAPILQGTTVRSVARIGGPGTGRGRGLAFRVATDDGIWWCRHVVIASGPHGAPRIPPGLVWPTVVPSNAYRRPSQLPAGGVLVVGASASGVQIADELVADGRDVVLAVGRHTRLPRSYRGRDVFRWLEATGSLALTIDDVPDPRAARREPSLQLIGRANAQAVGDLDLATLERRGVRLAGRLCSISSAGIAHFRDDLEDSIADADRRLLRLLARVDTYAARAGLADQVGPAWRPGPIAAGAAPRRLNLSAEGISTVVLATGFRPDHHWLRVPVTEPDGTIRQYRGITPAPGLYVVGQRFQHRRDSAFIGGARRDAAAVVRHLTTGTLGLCPATRRGVAA